MTIYNVGITSAGTLVKFSGDGAKSIDGEPLDPRAFGCPWNGVDDDLPGLQAMLASIPLSRTRPTIIRLPEGPGYCSGDLDITRNVLFEGHGSLYSGSFTTSKVSHAIIFPPLKRIILHGFATSADTGRADGTILSDLNIVSTQAIVSDAVGNWGVAMHQLSTSGTRWNDLPTNVPLGTCVIRSGTTVGSSNQEYYGDGHTRNTTHLVMFRCTTAGTKGSSQPTEFTTTDLDDLGTTIAANGGGTAVWTVESIPKDYVNNTAYVVGQRVVVPGDNAHVFEALEAGTSIAVAATTIAAGSNGLSLLQTTIHVADTTDFPTAGIICVVTSTGRNFVNYTGKTGTSFTGCSNVSTLLPSSGTMSTGDAVTGPFAGAPWGVPVRCNGHFITPPHAIEFYDIATDVASASNGQALPQSTINVDSTSGFASSGNLKIWTGSAYTTVAYTGKTETTFTGCTGGTGTLTTDNEVGQGVKWKEIFGGLVTILGNWCSVENCGIFGSIGAAVWITGNYKLGAAGGSNFWAVRRCVFGACGEGIATNSNNTNGGESAYIQEFFLGAGRTNVDASTYLNINGGTWANGRFGNAGSAVKDRTLGNNKHRIHYIQFSGGMPFRNDLLSSPAAGNFSVWDYLAHETELDPVFFSPAVVNAPVHGIHKDTSATVFHGTVARNLRSEAPFRTAPSKRVRSVFGAQNANVATPFSFQHSDDSYGIGINSSDDIGTYPTKWWMFGKANGIGFYTEQAWATTRPAASATWPGGTSVGAILPMWITQDRVWIGQAPNVDPSSYGFGTAAPSSGYFRVGSLTLNKTGGDNVAIGWQCTVTGSPGTHRAIHHAKRGEVSIAMADANQTPTAAQNMYRTFVLTGALTQDRTLFLAAPASNDDGAEHAIDASAITGGNIIVNVVGNPGTTVTVALGKTAIVRTNTGGVKRQTADV